MNLPGVFEFLLDKVIASRSEYEREARDDAQAAAVGTSEEPGAARHECGDEDDRDDERDLGRFQPDSSSGAESARPRATIAPRPRASVRT